MALWALLRRPTIELSNDIYTENSPEGTEIGSLTVLNGRGDYSFTLLRSDDRLKIVAAAPAFDLPAFLQVGETETDYEDEASYVITIIADNGTDPRTFGTFTLTVENVAVTLADLTINVDEILDGSVEDTVVGTLDGMTVGSTLSLHDTAGDRFKLEGNKIFTGATPTNVAVDTSHNITVRETHAEGTNSPHDTVFAISVVDEAQITQWGVPLIGAATTVATGSMTLVEPTGVAEGDLMVACIGYRWGSTFDLPAGWALVATQQSSGNTTSASSAAVASGVMAWIVRGASAPALTFTRDGGDVAIGRIISYSGGDETAPYHTGTANTLAVASVTATTGSITTTQNGELLVAMAVSGRTTGWSAFDAATAPSTASGAINTAVIPLDDTWTERTDTASSTGADISVSIADAVMATAGATGTIQATTSSNRTVMIVGAFQKRPVNTTYGNVIVASAALQATTSLQPAITDLRLTLGQMSALDFLTVNATTAAESITLSLTGTAEEPAGATAALDGKGLGAFLIKGTVTRLDICANDAQGISHGIYYYLEELGARWLLPNDKWIVIPSRSNLTYVVDQVVEPTYKVRGYSGTGGFHTNASLWGSANPQGLVTKAATEAWQRRQRYGAEYLLGKHVYQEFLADPAITTIVEANPTYLASVGGVSSPLRTSTGAISQIAKINAGNAAAVALFADWIVDKMATARLSTDKRLHTVVSVEPSDGGGWGDDTEALVLAGVGDGSETDQAWHIANAAAVAIAAEYPDDGSVIQLAYNRHAVVPSFPVEDNVISQVAPGGFHNLDSEILINDWGAAATRLAIYDYWSIPDWVWEEPVFNYLGAATELRGWDDDNIEAFQAESTYGAGSMGLGHYIAAHLMWDLDLDENALIDEWFTLAFGPAVVPMQRMLERWSSRFLLIASELGDSYADTAEALTLAAGDAAVTQRVLDYARYLHYLRLRYELAIKLQYGAPAKVVTISIASPGVVSWASHVLTNGRPVQFSVSAGGALPTGLTVGTVYWVVNAAAGTFEVAATAGGASINTSGSPTGTITARSQGAGWDDIITRTSTSMWSAITQKTDAEIETLLDEGAAAYPEPDFTPVVYTGDLTPVAAITWSDPGDVWGTIMPFEGPNSTYVYVPTGLTAIPLKVNQQVSNVITATRVSDGEVLFEQSITAATATDWTTLTINDNGGALVAGDVIKIRSFPGGDKGQRYYKYQTKPGVPLNLEFWLSPKNNKAPRLYFYVPTGQEQIIFYYPLGDYNNVFNFTFRNPSSVIVPVTERRDNRRTLIIDVPTGMDDAIWSVQNSVHPDFTLLMLTTPQSFALEPSVLLKRAL
jgi:hypothetical protein